MGYRHVMVATGSLPGSSKLPKWFVDKYKGCMDFSGSYWKSHHEYNLDWSYKDIKEDIQSVIKETGDDDSSIQLVFFSEEGLWVNGEIDIIHVNITANSIEESKMIKEGV